MPSATDFKSCCACARRRTRIGRAACGRPRAPPVMAFKACCACARPRTHSPPNGAAGACARSVRV
eukprot:6187143-Pleurochrysis_carterae.AAC.1